MLLITDEVGSNRLKSERRLVNIKILIHSDITEKWTIIIRSFDDDAWTHIWYTIKIYNRRYVMLHPMGLDRHIETETQWQPFSDYIFMCIFCIRKVLYHVQMVGKYLCLIWSRWFNVSIDTWVSGIHKDTWCAHIWFRLQWQWMTCIIARKMFSSSLCVYDGKSYADNLPLFLLEGEFSCNDWTNDIHLIIFDVFMFHVLGLENYSFYFT